MFLWVCIPAVLTCVLKNGRSACLQIVSQNRLAPIRRYAGAWPGGGTYADTPIPRSGQEIRRYAGTPIRRYADPGRKYADTPIQEQIRRYADTPIQEANTPIRRSGQGGWHGVSVYRCIGAGPPPPLPPPLPLPFPLPFPLPPPPPPPSPPSRR